MQHSGKSTPLSSREQLFLSLAEQLSRPFLQVSRLAELSEQAEPVHRQDYMSVIKTISAASLQLIENYSLSLRVHGKLTPLEFEPVAISSLLYDTAQQLTPYAQQYGVTLELDTGPGMQPVLTDRLVLQAALTSLGQVFVLAQAEADTTSAIRLSAHRSRHGIVAGLYGEAGRLGADSLRRAKALHGTARQPLQRLVSGSAAGVFVADSLLETLSARLHVARYHNLTGLAATLQPSRQLQLV